MNKYILIMSIIILAYIDFSFYADIKLIKQHQDILAHKYEDLDYEISVLTELRGR